MGEYDRLMVVISLINTTLLSVIVFTLVYTVYMILVPGVSDVKRLIDVSQSVALTINGTLSGVLKMNDVLDRRICDMAHIIGMRPWFCP